jgi:4-amino-4-deoxy-L-arabinose transferase-like glycosyltransferase
MLLGLLPFFSYISIVLITVSLRPSWGWIRSATRAGIAVGGYGIVTLEILSLLSAINRISLVLIWLLPTLLLIWALIVRIHYRLPVATIGFTLPRSWLDRTIIIAITLIVVLAGITAWYAPPNTYDSLTYHLPRVAHWAQDESLQPFATGILRQLYMSPGAEMGILHLYVLTQSDKMANLVQWSAMVLSLVGVVAVAREFGANRRGQILAVLFAATLPMGIAQATSAMTDYVAALWVILSFVESYRIITGKGEWIDAGMAGASVGMALLTKLNTAPFLIPIALWVLFSMLKKYSVGKILLFTGIVVLVICILNLGYFSRNWLVFGNPLGGGAHVSTFRNNTFSIPAIISNILRNMSLHVGTPWASVNEFLYDLVAKVHWKLGVDLTDPRTSIHPFFKIWSYPSGETRTPNTIHAFFIIVAGILAVIFRKRFGSDVAYYWLVLAGGFLGFSVLFKFTVLGSRYHMTFFILAAPLIGMIFGRVLGNTVIAFSSLALMLGAVPVLCSLAERPLIRTDSSPSILTMRRLDQYFVSAPNLDEPYFEMTELIEQNECHNVGISLGGDTAEYLLWVFLDAPNPDLTIDWIISRNDTSGKYRLNNFAPCAIICEGCREHEGLYNGLPLIYEHYGYRLYLRSQHSSDS